MGLFIGLRGSVAVAATTLAIGCGPAAPEPWTGSERQLAVIEPHEGGSRLVLVRPSGEREIVPFEGVDEATSVAWGLDGELLLASDPQHNVWTWAEDADQPTILHMDPSSSGSVRIWIASDPRYARITRGRDTDLGYDFRTSIIDLMSGDLLYATSSCEQGPSYFSWHGDGPDAVVLGDSCQGASSDYHLTHFSGGQTERLFEFANDEVPEVWSSPNNDLLSLAFADRWQLYDLPSRRLLREEPLDARGTTLRASHDGRFSYRLTGTSLAGYDGSGAERWRVDLGIHPGSIVSSPVDARILVNSGDCGGLTCIGFIDGEDGSTRFTDEPRFGAASWAPNGDALLVGPTEWEGPLQWMDLDSGETHDLTLECGSPLWSPDGEKLICNETCEAPESEDAPRPGQRLHLFERGLPLAEIPCGHYGSVSWSPDSDLFAASVTELGESPEDDRKRVVLFDLEGEALDLGPSLALRGWRPGPVR